MQELNEVERLKKFKTDSGWSYQKIANLMGVSLQSIINWTNEKNTPSPMARMLIRKFLADYSYKG